MKDVGIYGWGVVAPKSPDVVSFERNLKKAGSWLSAFNGFGPDRFLVGEPDFDFARYRDWIDARFPANRFSQLVGKMDPTTLFAVGAFIQSLEQNPGIESLLTELGTEAHVYVGTGLGALPTIYDASLELDRAQRRWNRFWAHPDRNQPLAAYVADPDAARRSDPTIPEDPFEGEALEVRGGPHDRGHDADSLADAQAVWNAYWAPRSDGLSRFLDALAGIEGVSVGGDIESSKIKVIREKERGKARLLDEWGAPTPPWNAVSTNVLWNIHNTPASQISMLGRITGLAFAPVAACSTFGIALKLGMDAIRRGEAKAVVIGATDPAPHPISVGTFNAARVLSADGGTSKPLTGLRGTHVAGGAAIWIIGERAFMEARGMRPIGMEPVAVGVSSDADHIITPSQEGPTEAIHRALAEAGIAPETIQSWDLHATATPGDFMEVQTLRAVVPDHVLVTARKGIFGHGMSVGGGWELMAQYMGMAEGTLHPTPLTPGELNASIGTLHDAWVWDQPCPVPAGPVGKLSMGVGGVNACVISRPLR